MTTALTTDQLRQAAARLPRVKLAHLPTPLEEATRFAGRLMARACSSSVMIAPACAWEATRRGTTSSSSARRSSKTPTASSGAPACSPTTAGRRRRRATSLDSIAIST